MRDLLSTIEQAVRARGWSARQASVEAVGSPELISNMRRGRVPSVERFRALCKVLDLEFYVGPYREALEVDERRLELALETADQGLATGGLRMNYSEKARLVAAIYQLIGKERSPANVARVNRLIGMVAGAGSGRGAAERVVQLAKSGEETS